jgi:hypothetical protein
MAAAIAMPSTATTRHHFAELYFLHRALELIPRG